MVKRIISVLILLCVMLTSFTGCFGRKKAGESFSMPIMEEPTSLDPQIADQNSEKLVAANCFEGLLRVDENGNLANGVAQSYTVSENGLTYTFHLRQDAHWAMFSGHKTVLGEDYADTFDITVVAADFKFAVERTMNPQTGSDDARLFAAVRRIEAPDDFTVVFYLNYADDNFLYALTAPGAMPCDEAFFNATNGKYGLDAGYLLCNGPLHVSRWTEESSVRMIKNEDYNGESDPCPASLTLYINKNETEAAKKMADLTYDAAFLSTAQFEGLEDAKDLTVTEIANVTYSFIFNQNKKNFQNKNLRLAVSKACNLSALAESAEKTAAADGLVPPSCKIGNTFFRDSGAAAALLAYDEAGARANFEEALLELNASSIEVVIACTQQYEPFIRQVVQGLQKTLGVKFVASVQAMSETELSAAVTDGNYDIVFYPFKADALFVREFLENFGTGNAFGFSSETFTSMLSAVYKVSGSYAEQRAACGDAENYLLQNAVILPVFYENSYFVTSRKTAGIYFYSSAGNICFIHAKKS